MRQGRRGERILRLVQRVDNALFFALKLKASGAEKTLAIA